MIRLTLLLAIVLFLALYAWKDWYKSLCGLILLMAVIEHPDMPKTMLGIQGLNPWNLLLLVILLAWLVRRRHEHLSWDMPPSISLLLLLYLGVVVTGFLRMMSDRGTLVEYTTDYLVSEHLINTVKWTIPGLLLFDGCRSRTRFRAGLASVLGIYLLLALQVIKWMPPSAALSGDALSERSSKILLNEIGYHRVNLSMMLAGASWAILATVPLTTRLRQVVGIVAASLVVVYAQALTAGRMGYVTWAVVGLLLCVFRWRRYLPLVPLVILAAALVVPGAAERMFAGFSADTRNSNPRLTGHAGLDRDNDAEDPDVYTITAGRNVAWPYVIDKISQSPIFGFGRLAMERTGLAAFLWDEFRESFPHPHNAYLELLLDNGWVGFLLVVPFYLAVLARSFTLFSSRPPFCAAIGGVASSLLLALLTASFGSQTFYPREGSVGMWCAIGLMLRVHVALTAGGGTQGSARARPTVPAHRTTV
jgi:O-antigen ligase